MEKDLKDLLLKDLCARLPYSVKVHAKYTDLGETIEVDGIVKMIDADGVVGIEVINDFSSAWTYVQIDNIKPYLLPLSSMTDEEYKEYSKLWALQDEFNTDADIRFKTNVFDWLNKNHFDYRGLIKKGLAIDATNLNIY